MEKQMLSIVIPCFNCARTLEEAVRSIYTQRLQVPFEVVLVDDGSTDNTRIVIKKLLEKYQFTSLITHEKNLGGGAARNTGIKMAKGDLIYCLDSDNYFDNGSLQRMITFLMEKQCDGVVFHERRFLIGDQKQIFTSYKNDVTDRPLELSDLFNGTNTMLDNFLFTKASYLRAGGYPEHHGFDTQGFEMRYLSTGNTSYVCPGTVFFHRQFQRGVKSYFEREYERGEYSKNMYLCIEDVLHLFSPSMIQRIIDYQIFRKTSLSHGNLLTDLRAWYGDDPTHFFTTGYKKYISKEGGRKAFGSRSGSGKIPDQFSCVVYYLRNGEYDDAFALCGQLLKKGVTTPVSFYILLRSALGVAGVASAEIEARAESVIKSMHVLPQKNDIRKSLPELFLGKITRHFQ